MPLLKVHAMIENKKMMQVVHYDTFEGIMDTYMGD